MRAAWPARCDHEGGICHEEPLYWPRNIALLGSPHRGRRDLSKRPAWTCSAGLDHRCSRVMRHNPVGTVALEHLLHTCSHHAPRDNPRSLFAGSTSAGTLSNADVPVLESQIYLGWQHCLRVEHWSQQGRGKRAVEPQRPASASHWKRCLQRRPHVGAFCQAML